MPEKHIFYSLPAPICVESLIYIVAATHPRRLYSGVSYDFWVLGYLEEGSQQIVLEGVTHNQSGGQMLVYPPGTFHEGSTNGCKKCIASFFCDSPLLYDLCGGPFDLSPALASEFSALVRWGAELFECRDATVQRFLPRGDITVCDLQLLKNRLENFLLALHKERCCGIPGSDSQLLSELVYILRANLAQTLTVEALAQTAGISVNRVKKLFREAYGCGPIHYFQQLKIEEAQRLLGTSRYNVSQVAELLGFSSVYYFSHRFKEKTGLSPREYMESLKEQGS